MLEAFVAEISAITVAHVVIFVTHFHRASRTKFQGATIKTKDLFRCAFPSRDGRDRRFQWRW